MSITAERKTEVINDNARAKGDTGSPEVQVAILTDRINTLTAHFKAHHKDNPQPPRPPHDGQQAPQPPRLSEEEGRGPLLRR